MHFDRNPKKNSTSPRGNNNSTMPNFQLPSRSNTTIPKNNIGAYQNGNKPRPRALIGYNPDDGTFSPIPPNFRYTVNVPSHYSESDLDWGEPSFGMDPLEDNMTQSVSTNSKNVLAQDNYSQTKIVSPSNDDMFDQLYSNTSILDNEHSSKNPTDSHQEQILVQSPAPQETSDQYPYNNLEDALDAWISTLSVNKTTKSVYRSRLIKFVRKLDAEGIRKPDFNTIDNYCSQNFNDYSGSSLHSFNISLKRFSKWLSAGNIYKKIKPYQENVTINQSIDQKKVKPQIDPKAQYVERVLANLFNVWSKSLKNDFNINTEYKMYVLKFMLFLIQLKTLQPTLADIKVYFHNSTETQGLNVTQKHKMIIKSFLQFMERMNVPQNPEIYKFLDSN